MIEQFRHLSSDEVELMIKVPVLVCILIAGADDDIDNSEIRQAVNISKLKQFKAREDLISYYQEAGRDFEDKLKILIQQLPANSMFRNPKIIEELERLNIILPKLDKKFAIEFYESIKGIAKKIAEASGGVLGYMAVGYEESKLIDLEMIKDPAKD